MQIHTRSGFLLSIHKLLLIHIYEYSDYTSWMLGLLEGAVAAGETPYLGTSTQSPFPRWG